MTTTIDGTSSTAYVDASVPLIPINERAILSAILFELRQLNFYIKQLPLYLNTGQSITDEDADFRVNLTSSDVNFQR